MELIGVMVRDAVTQGIQPVRDELEELAKRTRALEDAKRKHSGEVQAITKVAIPQMQSEADRIRKGDMGAVADAFDKMAHVVNDVADNVAAMRTEIQPRAVVSLQDGKGGTSVRPASLVAAESSIRTENKQDGMAKVVLDVALDTADAKKDSADAKKWQKRVTTPLIVATPIVVAIVREVWPLIFPHQ